MSDFLSSYPFLDDAERDLLRKHGVDDADSVLGLGADGLVRHAQLSPGKAGKLVRAAERASTPTTAQPAVPTRDEQVRAALRQAADDPSKVKALLELGVQVVVLTPEDRVDPGLSVMLHEHIAAGARVPATWRGRKIARVDQLATPPIWCSPRPPHRELQAGADEVSGVAWAALGVDGLRLAAHGYARGFFEGRAEEAAFKILMTDEHSNPRRRQVRRANQAGLRRERETRRLRRGAVPERAQRTAQRDPAGTADGFDCPRRDGDVPGDVLCARAGLGAARAAGRAEDGQQPPGSLLTV